MILKLLYRAIYKLETFKLSLHNSLIFCTILYIKRVSRTKCALPCHVERPLFEMNSRI